MDVIISTQLIQQIILALKGISVNGYDSMDKLVGLVRLFESIMDNVQKQAQEQAEHPKEED